MTFTLWRDLFNIPSHFSTCVVTLGNFDGVHLGHRQLIQRTVQAAAKLNIPSVLITFEPQPNEFFQRGIIPPRLLKLREKLLLMRSLGLDYVLCLRFNEALAYLSAEDFIQTILIERLHVQHVVIGDDYRFGCQRRGDFELLSHFGKTTGFTVEAMPTYRQEGKRVSSSLVRSVLQAGNMQAAEQLLGRRYGMSGKVVHGDKRGRVLGFPTANLWLHRKAVPIQGIFVVRVLGLKASVPFGFQGAGKALVGEEAVYGVANVGNRPTIAGEGRTLLEVYLFDFDREIYGQYIYVEFLHKLRDEERYDSLELLREQIARDVQAAYVYTSRT